MRPGIEQFSTRHNTITMEPRLLVLLALASAAIAGPIKVQQTNECATECPASTKLTYAPGTTYVYDYRVDYSTSMSGASEDSAKLTLTTTAELEVLGPCEMALSLRDTRLFHSDAMGGLKAADKEDSFRRGLEASPLRFSYQDGAVEHICTATREEPWVMNVKKGVLSAFQNNMDDLSKDQNVTETDVTGTCKTEYTSVSNGYYSDSVRKTKDILTCTDRHDYRTILQMVPYTEPSELQSIPLMKTTHECDQVIQRGGVLQSTTCTETHVYRPFSNGQSGGATSVTQTLTYNTYKRRVLSRKDTISSTDSLLFDHSASRLSASQARQQVEQKLKEVCESTSYDVRPESPRLFSELVYALKALDKQTMDEVFRQLKTKTLCPSNNKAYKTFLDALPVVSTSSSVSLMTSFIINEDVDEIQAGVWIPSLAFIKAPTSEMLLEAKPLLDSDKFGAYALLPVSSMVNNFCFRSSACEQSYAVLSTMDSLERRIPQGCDASGKDFLKVLLTLRAIGNAGHASRAVPVIAKCLTNSDNSLEIRVAAANAFRRMPCDAEETQLWNTYENSELDSELRIAAYQALMRCPSDATLGKMAASLGGELDEQVGAYVYSHMTNLKQTSDPHKQMVSRALDNLVIPTKYMSNPIKASTNLEVSALINKINTGFVAESNLVWSNNAQVPRSASANLTVELFGQSINLVDFGGRVEGLEHLIKNIWGAKGASRIETSKYRGSVYGRVFGNEMFFMHSDQIKLPTEKPSDTWLQMLVGLKEKQELAYTFSKEIMDVGMVIPSVAGLPINIEVNGSAVVDLLLKGKADVLNLAVSPRSMEIDGEVRPSAALEISGTMSVDAYFTKTGLRMRNTLHTSTSLKGRIQLERGELFTVEFDSPREKMEIFDASSKFFILHNNVEQEQKMITENRKEFEWCSSETLSDVTGAVLCGKISYPNASMQSEGPYFPLTGPSSASLILRKTDTHSGYKLLVKRIQTRQQSVAQISFNTPGSRTNRVILIDLTADRPRNSLSAQVVTPWKKMEYTGFVIDTDETKTVSGTLTVDSRDIYGLTAEVKISKSKRKIRLSPLVVIRRPGQDKIELSGFIAKKGFKSFDVDLSLSGLQELPYNIKTSISNGNEEKSIHASVSADGGKSVYSIEAGSALKMPKKKINMNTSLKINTPKRNIVLVDATANYKQDSMLNFDGTLDIHKLMKRPASLKVDVKQQTKRARGTVYTVSTSVKSSPVTGRFSSNISLKKRLYSTKTVLDYSIPKVSKNKITLSGKIRDKSTSSFTKYTVTGDFDVKKNPEYNAAVNVDLDHKKRHTDFELKVRYGKNPKDKVKTLFFNTVLDRKVRSYKDVKVTCNMKADAPEYDVDVTISGEHDHNSGLLDSKLNVAYGKGKEYKHTVYLKSKSKNKDHYVGKATIAWPGAEYMVNSNLKEVGKKHYTGELKMKSADGVKHSIDGDYKMTGPKTHEFTTKMSFKGYKRLVLSGSAGMHKKKPHVSGQIQYGKDAYGLSASAKALKNNAGEMVVELTNPDRRMVLKLDGEKSKHQYEGSLVASWDADKDENKKITITGSTYNKESRKGVSVGGDMTFTSPFENFENLASSFKYGSDGSQHNILGKMNMGDDRYMTNVILQKPISIEHISGSIEAETPFKEMRKLSAQVFHTWEDKVSTVVKGTLNNENAMLDVQGKGGFKDFNGKVIFTSSIENAKDISVTVSHALNPEDVNSFIEVSHDNQLYRSDLIGNFVRNGWHIKTDGSLTFNSPDSEFSTSWEHKNGKKRINSKLDGKWDEDKLNFHLTGSRESHPMEKFTGELKIDSSRKQLRDVVISFVHKHGDNMLKTKAEITKKGKTKALSDIKITKSDKKAGLDFTLKSPYHKDIEANVDAKYGKYPMTASGELKWSNNKKLAATTTLNFEQWDDASLEITLDTPSRNYKNTILRASNKKEGDELVSHASLEYGKSENIDLEARHAFNDQTKMARLRLSTPFEQIKSLDTGLRFDGKAIDFESNADFELLPLVEKFQGTAKFQYGDDLTSSLRLDTPYPEYPHLELSASDYGEGRGRKSHIEARLHPQKVYSADAAYSFELPISVDVNVNSPHPEYDNIGFVLQHNHSPSSVSSFGELRYQPDKKIESELNADWASNIEGNMLVKTPFPSYEINKVTLRHQGEWSDFSSHGEIEVAEKNVVADATFKAGDHTEGDFSLSSPIPGMEKLSVNVMKKGGMKNFKGEVTIFVNNEKTEVKYDHKLKKKLFQTSFKVNSPNTKPLKFSIEHKLQGDRSFTNEISASYGRKYQIDTDLTISCNCPDFQSQGSVKYKLGKKKNTARFNFNKFGELKDMSFSGNSAFNDDEITIYGTWKTVDGLEADVQLNTPFDGFKNTGVTLSHQGELKSFRSSGSVTYMDNKKINGMFELTTDMPRLVRLDSSIDTPFENFPSAAITLNHNFDEERNSINSDASLTTPVKDFGAGSLIFEKTGDMNDLSLTTTVKRNGRKVSGLKMTHLVANKEVHSSLEFESTESPDWTINFDHEGDLSGFSTKTSGNLDSDRFYSEISRSGPIEDITISAKAGYKDDVLSVIGSLNSQRGYDGSLEVLTPFEGYENTKVEANGALDEDFKDVSGKVTLTTTVSDFGTGDISLSKSGSLDDLLVVGSMTKNNDELAYIRMTNAGSETELHTTVSSRGTIVPAALVNLDISGDANSHEAKVKVTVDNTAILDGTYNFDKTDDTIKAGTSVTYNIDENGPVVSSLTIDKEGQLDDVIIKIVSMHDGEEITVDGNMNLKKEKTGSLTIRTPYEGYKKVGVSFTHGWESDRISSEGRINLVDGEQYFGKVTMNRNDQTGFFEGTMEMNTPIEGAQFTKVHYTHTITKEDAKVYTFVEYGDSKKIVYDFSASVSPKIGFNVLIQTPFEGYKDLAASANLETKLPTLSINSEVSAGEGRKITLTGSLDTSKDITGNIALTTPLEEYSNVGLSFEHSGKWKNFKSEGRVTYKDGKEISGNVHLKLKKNYLNVELKTPFSGHKNMKFEVSERKTEAEKTTTTYLKYGRGQVFQTETTVTTIPRPGLAITIKTPLEKYSKLEASVSYDTSMSKFEFNSKVKAGEGKRFSVDATFDGTDDVTGSIDIKTPIEDFNKVGLSFSHINSNNKFTSEGKVVYMDGKDISGKVEIEENTWRGLIVTAELNTPFENQEKTKLELTLDDTAPSYSAGYSLDIGNKLYSANGKFNVISDGKVDGSLEVVMPIEGAEYTKAEYQHSYDDMRTDGSVSLTYGNSKTISGELKSSKVPKYDATLTIRTPFEGFEEMKGSATFDSKEDRYGTSTSLDFGSDQLYSMTSYLDMSAEPFRASTQISTPFNDFRNMELVYTHEGSINDFRCTGFLSTPITDNINAVVNMRYNSLIDMEGSASVKSSFEGMDDLLAEIKVSDVSGEKKIRTAVGWTNEKQIVFDAMVSEKETWYKKKVNGEWSISTPFEAVRKLTMQADHTGKKDKIKQSLSVELNDEKMLDLDTEYKSKSKHEATVTFRKPQPMQYSVTANSDAGITEAEVVANWNRNEMDSNIRITASHNDQSDSYKTERNVDIALEYASRKMGVVHKLSSTAPLTTSFGKLYWDSDSTSRIFYDMEIKDSSRRRKEITEGVINLGLPSRTLSLSGSSSNNKAKQSADATFSWDADRADKQIGIKGSITRGDKIKGDITLSMPSIRKEIRVDSEIAVKNDRIILDARTDISYSKDSRKTLTLVSKLEDISDYYSHYNYSLAVGVSHPYTNVDIQMTSHLGSSDEKMTIGLSTDYLTARRQNKNLGLLAEINKLKRQLNLQITNPLNKVEYVAEEISTSPYQVRMLSKVDDVETFHSDLIVNEDEKSFELNMVRGTEGLKLSAGYPSLKEFRTEVSRSSYDSETTEAVLAVRLNTTRLMHTRLHWDPDMAQNLLQDIRQRLLVEGIEEYQTFREIKAALSEEITGKYKDITAALNEEVRPLVDELDKEFDYIERQMNKFLKDLKKAYKNNDFYLQEMGPEAYEELEKTLSQFKKDYNKGRKTLIKTLNKDLDKMLEFPIQEKYDEMVNKVISVLDEQVRNALRALEFLLANTDAALVSYRERMLQAQQDTKDAVYNSTYMNYVSDTLGDIDMSAYIPSWEMPEEYSSAIYTAADHIGSGVDMVMGAPVLRHVRKGTNELYQQGVWAYNYWQLEKNIFKHSENILRLIEEIVRDELWQYAEEIKRVYYPITVWDPEHGEVQAEFRLPVDVTRLDEVPDLSPLAKRFTIYLPDQSTMEAIYEIVPDMWSSLDQDEVKEQLAKYKPTKRFRGSKKGKNHRRRKVWAY
ncbi:apolipophorin long isoform [Elysia marginata]|uniref:Apolipophorin long isoform n=1 Tax=Elysia marginata TaxID=1093978 RepID=A0AAV4I4W5_9GAST|nr:apolipophorin long isoform [Elysia marginata]